jgi:hypothetical protein
MKQISIMDSFFKKQKNKETDDVTPAKPIQTKTAEKIEAEQPPARENNHQNEDEPANNFKELISNGDFSYEKIVIDNRKKRRMDVEDDSIPRRTEPPQSQRQMEEMDEDNSTEKERGNKKMGSTAKSGKKN